MHYGLMLPEINAESEENSETTSTPSLKVLKLQHL